MTCPAYHARAYAQPEAVSCRGSAVPAQSHEEYLNHLKEYIGSRADAPDFPEILNSYKKEIVIITGINTDPAVPILQSLYSSPGRGDPRDPVCMLRSLILMTVSKEKSITEWVEETRKPPFFIGVLAGFEPKDTPGVGTYYDFMRRIIDGPYQKPCEHVVRRSDSVKAKHRRNRQQEKEAKKDSCDPSQSKSEKLAEELLRKAAEPRPDDFQKILEDFLIFLGIVPSIESGLLNLGETVVISGDGSILATAACAHGKPTCDCHKQGIRDCGHDRIYTSPTAEWCYDHTRDLFVFGDRYYHLVVYQNGHDFPLHTLMPGGNESDHTLSLRSVDRFLKAADENGLNLGQLIFVGDKHHDTYAHYGYFREKNIIPVIPLSEKSRNILPHSSGIPNVRLNADGIPLCPAGAPMRFHGYNKKKRTQVFSCPAKRNTHRGGKSVYVFHDGDCPPGKDCKPESSVGPFVYIKSDTDMRLFPPIPRNSARYTEIMNQRSGSERMNSVVDSYNIDGAHRNADYSLIRLYLADTVHHAVIRYIEALKTADPGELLEKTLQEIRARSPDYGHNNLK